MAEPAIKIIPTPYQQVLALLHTDILRVIEQAIASEIGCRIIEDYSTTCTSFTQSEMSVSGMSVSEIEAFLLAHRDQIIRFGIAFLRDEAATDNTEEYPEGEEQDRTENKQFQGLGVGFGIKYAIFYHFLANRSKEEFLAFLKNRRIPHQAKFAREMRRVFEAVQQ